MAKTICSAMQPGRQALRKEKLKVQSEKGNKGLKRNLPNKARIRWIKTTPFKTPVASLN
jgi:hypothetical protein